MTETIIAAADGSALGNPGPAGWAWYIDEDRWAAGGWEHGTNNMGELKAVLDLFEATAHLPKTRLHIICDSQYTINSITKWMPGWKKKGWKKSDGKPVLNIDLMKALDAAIAGRNYTFEWVKGHTGHPLNEAADRRANEAAQAYRDGEAPNYGPGFGGPHDSAAGAIAGELALSRSALHTDDAPGVLSSSDRSLLDSIFDPAPANTADSPAPVAPEASPADILAEVRACENQVLSPSIYGSEKLLGALLHEDLAWVVPTGQTTDRATVLRYRDKACASTGQPQEVTTTLLSPDVALIVSNLDTPRGRVLRSSTWTATGGSWKLRYRQDTASRN
ncbi:RNase H family protein [Rothia nasimurium]|uniref:RNase H family protein n=1 Tax=Rothia nasimurium TaxID=85336 RepID=UPI003B9F0165